MGRRRNGRNLRASCKCLVGVYDKRTFNIQVLIPLGFKMSGLIYLFSNDHSVACMSTSLLNYMLVCFVSPCFSLFLSSLSFLESLQRGPPLFILNTNHRNTPTTLYLLFLQLQNFLSGCGSRYTPFRSPYIPLLSSHTSFMLAVHPLSLISKKMFFVEYEAQYTIFCDLYNPL